VGRHRFPSPPEKGAIGPPLKCAEAPTPTEIRVTPESEKWLKERATSPEGQKLLTNLRWCSLKRLFEGCSKSKRFATPCSIRSVNTPMASGNFQGCPSLEFSHGHGRMRLATVLFHFSRSRGSNQDISSTVHNWLGAKMAQHV
jgi:hypothetical protein